VLRRIFRAKKKAVTINSYGGKYLFEEITNFSFSSNIVLLATSLLQGLSWEADSHSSG
jgi:hypothetical protein